MQDCITVHSNLCVVADDSKISYEEETTDDKGVHKATFEAKYDGKDYPIKGDPNSDAFSCQREGSHELRTTVKKGWQDYGEG